MREQSDVPKHTHQPDLLRLLTCGSVDDGKSTLIGRLLYDAQKVPEDQLKTLEAESKKFGTVGEGLDLALLLDGLQAEREQGITIDVAYRYFSSARRTFILADSPGHEQYTRNMVTAASVSDLAVLLVDAVKGITIQTRRHSSIVHLLGIKHVVLAVNKMDLVGFSQDRFDAIVAVFQEFATRLGLANVTCVPLSARDGDNVVHASTRMRWYRGPTLMAVLENAETAAQIADQPFRMPVQYVARPDANFRGFCGAVTAGHVQAGDPVAVLPSGRTSRVKKLATPDGDAGVARVGDAVTIVLEDEIDISRGDVIAAAGAQPNVADQISAHLVWFADEPMLPGRPYLIRLGMQTATATVSQLKHKINVENLDHIAGRQLDMNEIGNCNLSFSRPLVFEPYETNSSLGGFILIDKMSNETVAAGLILFALRRATNIHWQSLDVDRATRSLIKGHKPCCLWFTGLSGSGKSTIANLLEKRLVSRGHHTFLLDGDNVRHGLSRDLGFTDADRVENIRRVAEVAKLMVEAGLIVLVSFISPFRAERQMARELFAEGEFLEIFVDTPLEECERRDPKGLYRKARQGLIANFTGIDSVYEPPLEPELSVGTTTFSPDQLVERILSDLGHRRLTAHV
jgi:bifunctional enzyme CysN/CysC